MVELVELLIVFMLFTVAAVAAVLMQMHRTCTHGGCGHQVQGSDDRCAICRLPLDGNPTK